MVVSCKLGAHTSRKYHFGICACTFNLGEGGVQPEIPVKGYCLHVPSAL